MKKSSSYERGLDLMPQQLTDEQLAEVDWEKHFENEPDDDDGEEAEDEPANDYVLGMLGFDPDDLF